jgi:hypothetical protein
MWQFLKKQLWRNIFCSDVTFDDKTEFRASKVRKLENWQSENFDLKVWKRFVFVENSVDFRNLLKKLIQTSFWRIIAENSKSSDRTARLTTEP